MKAHDVFPAVCYPRPVLAPGERTSIALAPHVPHDIEQHRGYGLELLGRGVRLRLPRVRGRPADEEAGDGEGHRRPGTQERGRDGNTLRVHAQHRPTQRIPIRMPGMIYCPTCAARWPDADDRDRLARGRDARGRYRGGDGDATRRFRRLRPGGPFARPPAHRGRRASRAHGGDGGARARQRDRPQLLRAAVRQDHQQEVPVGGPRSSGYHHMLAKRSTRWDSRSISPSSTSCSSASTAMRCRHSRPSAGPTGCSVERLADGAYLRSAATCPNVVARRRASGCATPTSWRSRRRAPRPSSRDRGGPGPGLAPSSSLSPGLGAAARDALDADLLVSSPRT